VAGDEVAAGGALFFENRVNRTRHGENRRLRILRQLQLFIRAFEAEPRDRIAESVVDLLEHTTRSGKALRDVLPHSGVLAALSRENEGGVVLHGGECYLSV
jgi:hypothetical protein